MGENPIKAAYFLEVSKMTGREKTDRNAARAEGAFQAATQKVITVSTENKKFTAGISAILTMKYPGNRKDGIE